MDARLALRSARHLAGLSQRALAERAGVPPSAVAALESGGRQARWDVVVALLQVCGVDLSFADHEPPVGPDQELRNFLTLSTSARLYWSLGGRLSPLTGQGCPVWQELGRLARCALVVLAPEACAGVWLPECGAAEPLPVLASPYPGRSLPEDLELVRLVGPAPGRRGTVPVGVGPAWEVHVLPPLAPALQREPGTAARLRLAAQLLLEGESQDEQGRSRAAHRCARVGGEHAWVMTRRRFSGAMLETPDPRDRRDWRVGGDASFRTWLIRRGYPLDRYGHRDQGP